MNFKSFDKYLAVLRTQLLNSIAYPLDLATRSITIVFFVWIFGHLWEATYSAMGQTVIAGLSVRETLWYFMVAETIVLSRPRLSYTIAESVKDGSVAYLLNKPYNFLLYHFSVSLGDGLSRVPFNALAGGAVAWWMVGPPPTALGIPLALVAIAVGWLIDFCFTAMIGLAAFVTEDVAAFDWIYSKFILLLGGVLIPLDFFPDGLRGIAQALPFAYTVYGPAHIFVTPDPARFAALLLGQAAWLAVLLLVLAWVWRRGARSLSINGG